MPRRLSAVTLAMVVLPTMLATFGCGKSNSTAIQRDVVYGRKFGTALTMDVYQPQSPNGAAIICIISGGWISNPNVFTEHAFTPLLKHGYTVFAVTHSSLPRYSIVDITQDITRACRFIRHNCSTFGIDKDRIGALGVSSGGHLAIFLGTNYSAGVPSAEDPVDRQSSDVAAVVAFAPPCDFLNYGENEKNAFCDGTLRHLSAGVDFQKLNQQTNRFERITELTKVRTAMEAISPIYAVSSDDAPTLILHGDADEIVPLQQPVIMIEKFKKSNVPAELIVQKGVGHHTMEQAFSSLDAVVSWFDKHLLEHNQ